MDEREVVRCLALPSNEQRAKAIVPTVRSFHHPPPWGPVHASHEWCFAFLSYMRHDTALADCRLTITKGIPFVHAAVRGPSRPASRLEHHGIERRCEGPLVMHVRAAQDHRERDPAAIGEDVPLDPQFRPIGRVRPGEVPPFGALTMTASSAPHFH